MVAFNCYSTGNSYSKSAANDMFASFLAHAFNEVAITIRDRHLLNHHEASSDLGYTGSVYYQTVIDLAFIQLKLGTKLPLNETAYLMWDGCEALGIETRFFEFIQDIQGELTSKTLVHGGITNVKRALTLIGVPMPEVLEAPEELLPFFGRRLWKTTMKEVRAYLDQGRPVFIKPLKVQKAFTGHVIDGSVGTLIQTASFEDDFEILASETVNFLVEYRILVHQGLMFACRHYRGDFTKAPDFQVAYDAISAFTKAPVGYSLDLGVTDDGRTLIVEVNDAWALGAYGTASVLYARMVIDRWEEMTRTENG